MSKTFSKVVVVGTSVGGVEALRQLAFQLSPMLRAPVLVVLHTSPGGPGLLPSLLASAGQVPAQHGRDKEKMEPGRIYVAPPDHHLEIEDGRLRVNRGPKINMTRPAIDNLFHSAARAYGKNAIGVLLTGSLADGVLGLADIKAHGGSVIVQDPDDALCGDLPRNAIDRVKVDHVLPLKQIAPLLEQLVNGPEWGASKRGAEKRLKVVPIKGKKKLEIDFDWVCPECHGPLKELNDTGITRFRCRVGHEYSTENLIQAHGDSMERALWAAAQVLEERAALLEKVCFRMPDEARSSKQDFQQKAEKFRQHAGEIKRMLETMDTGRE